MGQVLCPLNGFRTCRPNCGLAIEAYGGRPEHVSFCAIAAIGWALVNESCDDQGARVNGIPLGGDRKGDVE